MTRKRKVTYPAAGSANRRAPPDPGPERSVRPNLVSIDLDAGKGRPGLSVGDRVRILGTGLYAGEEAVIERFAGSAVPSAVVRTDAGNARQIRTIDLEPLPKRD
jgi:hypothetical protein